MADQLSSGKALIDLVSGFKTLDQVPAIEIHGVATNSKQVTSGCVFIALKGINSHGIDYAEDAVKANAVVVIYDGADDYSLAQVAKLKKQIEVIWVGVFELAQANGFIVSRFFDKPAKAMTMIAVTGTDGKTSVTHLLVQALTKLGKTCASIGTLGYGINNQITAGSLTTPDVVSIQSRLSEFKAQNCDTIVMEVSSHALHQYRVNGCDFDIAILTNLGQDHLDYHHSMQAYGSAKMRLFTQFKLSSSILNVDDEFGLMLFKQTDAKSCLGFSVSNDENAKVRLISAEINEKGQKIKVKTPVGELLAEIALIGTFNLDNCLACIATLVEMGFKREQIELAISDLQPIPGRMQQFNSNSEMADALVDFAHTEQALRACLSAAREHTKGKLWCVFGCGGDRDNGKRAGMGRTAEDLADYSIVTDDNPRTESSEQIVDDILKGMQHPDQATVIHNRKTAIEYALLQAQPDDLVVIAGKGHEEYQIIGDQHHPFSDQKVLSQVMGLDHD